MMLQIENYQTVTYSYTTIAEMMAHIGDMAGSWEIVSYSKIALKASFKRPTP